jgi:integrative and conjugative element protein (TIGR02256 family)
MARLWLAQAADALIRAEARSRRLVETGGPLFGYLDPGSGDSVVVLAYGPGPRARHRPWSIAPDREATQAAVKEVHASSEGALSYIGEWHTHPGGTDRPSRQDLNSIATIASEEGVDVAEPLMMIVPTVVMRRRVRVRTVAAYQWDDQAEAVIRLELTSAGDQRRPSANSPSSGRDVP